MNWQRIEDSGNWELTLPAKGLKHGQLYKLHVYWDGGFGERIPSYANRVVQDEATKIFSAQVWNPAKPYHFKKENFKPQRSPLLIYECHIGMAQDAEKVGTYNEFRENVLPRIVADGYKLLSKLWPFKNILTMVLLAIMFQVSLLPLHASALPKN